MKPVKLLLTVILTLLAFYCNAQTDDIKCNPYLLMDYFNQNAIPARTSGEKEIGKASAVYAGNGRVESKYLTLTVVLPPKATNPVAYGFYRSKSMCTITNPSVRLGDPNVQCWATSSSQIAWGSIGQPRISYGGNATITVTVDMENGSDCDPRGCILVVSYRQ